LVDRMSESKLLEDMNKLFEKLDSYDKRLTSMGSDLSKVHHNLITRYALFRSCRRNKFF
jgi:hypothetical protein